MRASKEVQFIEKKYSRPNLPTFRTGDSVIVHARIKEGEKARLQYVEGVVIRKSGHGSTKTFTLRKVSDGIGVEIIYPFNSENVANIEVVSHGSVRRSRLYYLRGLTGKAARLKTKDGVGSSGMHAANMASAKAKAQAAAGAPAKTPAAAK